MSAAPTPGSLPEGAKTGYSPPRPAAAQLPGTAQPRGPAAIYLSWGGEIYGPSSREEVVAGIRTSWFEQGTLYWHEGLDEWNPVHEFPISAESAGNDDGGRRVKTAELPTAPSLPSTAKTAGRPRTSSRRARAAKARATNGEPRPRNNLRLSFSCRAFDRGDTSAPDAGLSNQRPLTAAATFRRRALRRMKPVASDWL